MTPLSGIRVVDFGHVWAGPYCSATLADLGAEVIKIESPKRLDVHRRQGPYPDNQPGVNRSGVWNAQNRNKKSVSLSLTERADCEHAIHLVSKSDVVVENFSPGVMKKLGLDYAHLREAKPDIVMASLSAFGQAGPQSNYVGYGPSLDAWSGLCSLNADYGRSPEALGGMFPDTASALYACFGILAALRRRDATGQGCYIDLSELEVSALLLADLLVQFPNEDIPADWYGNSDPYAVPQGTYQCAGEDEWILISVDNESAWLCLCSLLGKPGWEHLSSPAARKEQLEAIESELRRWSRKRSAQSAFTELQSHGVPAAVALTVEGLFSDEQLRAREIFREVEHAEVGRQVLYAPIWRFDGAKTDLKPAPLLGHDTEDVLAMLRRAPARSEAS